MNISLFKSIFTDVFTVSKSIQVKNKKLKIFCSVALINLATFLDIVAILTFTSFFESSIEYNSFLKIFVEKSIFLPFYVFFRFLFIYLEKLNITNLQLDIEKYLRKSIMDEVFDKGNYKNSDSYFYITQLSAHVAYFYSAVTSLINVSVQSLVYFIYLLLSKNLILLYFVGGAFFLLPVTKYLAKKSRNYVDKLYNETQNLYADIQKLIDSIFVIKILKQSQDEIGKYNNKLENYKIYNFNSYKFTTLNYLIPNFLTLLSLSFIVNIDKIVNYLTLEFIGIVLRLFQSLGEINKYLTMTMNSHVHLEKYFNLIKNYQETYKQNYTKELFNENVAIKFENVDFKYLNTEEYILKNSTFSINEGQRVLLTGPNGSGKSTILGLIAGVYFAEKGSVVVNTDSIGYVGVSSKILDGSIYDNIKFGVEDEITRTDEFKTKAINLIKKLQLFENFDDSAILNFKISEKTLSTGQKQKIAFIRTLLKRPKIILLDEATANLDEKSLKIILEILRNSSFTIINSTHLSDDIDYDLNLNLNIVGKKKVIQLKNL